MAGNDTTAPILEVIVSQHHSEHTSLNPEEPRVVRPQPPIYPIVRAVAHSESEGSAKPDGVIQFPVPTSRETDIHFLESAWLEIDTLPGYDPASDIDNQIAPAIFRAIKTIELLTLDKIHIETLTPLDILTWTQTTTPRDAYDTLQHLSYGDSFNAGSAGSNVVQLSIPFSILKDGAPFPLVSLSKTGMLVRITYTSSQNMPSTLDLRGTRIWFQGLTLPPNQIKKMETMNLILPITTFTNQTRVYEKGSAATLETFLLEDTRDLRSLVFMMGELGETTTTLQRFKGAYYKDPDAPDVYRSLRECWLDIGSQSMSRPLRPEVVRYITRLGRCGRISKNTQGEDGLHILPISTVYRASLHGYSAPGALTRNSSKVSLRLRFDPIDRVPGDRDRFEVTVITQRGQRLSIKNGLIESVDSFHGDEVAGDPDAGSQLHDITPSQYGSTGNQEDGIPDEVLGYLTQSPTHEAFSRTTRSVALRGSHRFGETIVADLPLTADLVGGLTLQFRLPELPDGYRWINGIGYYILSRVVVRHEDTILYDCPGEALYLLNQQDNPLGVRAREDANNVGYIHPNGLDTVSFPTTGSPDGRIHVRIPWSFGTKGYSPLPTAALRHRHLRLEIRLAEPSQVIVPTTVDPYNPPTISGGKGGHIGCAGSNPAPNLLPAGVEGGFVITETTANLIGYTIPSELRTQLMSRPRQMILRQLHMYRFDDPEGLMRTIPINHGLRRLIYVSPQNSEAVGGERGYNPVGLQQIYAGSKHWYHCIPPSEFFQDWSRLTSTSPSTGSGSPDIALYSVDFNPGFINASRFDEFRFQTTPGRLVVVAISDEPFRIQKGKIGPLYAD
jgi:hypothetical protein